VQRGDGTDGALVLELVLIGHGAHAS
jgi:hypothetical protein